MSQTKCVRLESLQVTSCPKKKELEVVANEVVKRFPSLLDKDGDRVLSSGYASLLSQLVNRYDNTMRSRNQKTKRVLTDSAGAPPAKKLKTKDRFVINTIPITVDCCIFVMLTKIIIH